MESTRPKALPAAESSTDPQDLPLPSYHLLRSSLGRLTRAVKNHWNRIMAELLVVFENSNLFSKRSAPTKDRLWHVARATRPIIQPCRSPESGSPSPAWSLSALKVQQTRKGQWPRQSMPTFSLSFLSGFWENQRRTNRRGYIQVGFSSTRQDAKKFAMVISVPPC
jgi:hypothetical protein